MARRIDKDALDTHILAQLRLVRYTADELLERMCEEAKR